MKFRGLLYRDSLNSIEVRRGFARGSRMGRLGYELGMNRGLLLFRGFGKGPIVVRGRAFRPIQSGCLRKFLRESGRLGFLGRDF